MRQTSNGVHGLRAAGMAWLCAGLAGSGIAAAQGVDLIVGDITGSTAYVSAGSPKAYSLGLSYCNLGDTPANFDGATANHPIVTQNMYRLSNGRFEQIGQAWAAHLVAGALQQSLCSTCTPWADLSKLGAGCSSTDSASFLGTQANFGAKSEVNAAAGTFVWPRVNMGTGSGAAFRRLQVNIADLQPGPLYFVSSMIVAADDAAAGNALNNESYRRVTVGFAAPSEPLTMADTTQRGAPAIQAWKDNGLGAGVPDPDVILTSVDVPGDGRFWIASKATHLASGAWHYEYAVQNLNSERAGAQLTVPTFSSAQITNIDFHGVTYHSGEVYSNAAWTGVVQGAGVQWTCPETYQQNVNASALRWDTIYNFGFDADVAPASGSLRIDLFKPGTPAWVAGLGVVPGAGACGVADFNCDGDVGTDADIDAFFACLSGACPAPPCTSTADFNGDGDVGTDADIEAFFRVLAGGGC